MKSQRTDRFAISKRLYAVDTSGLQVLDSMCTLRAVWYRSRSGKVQACYGAVWDILHPAPADWREFMERCSTRRYGGRTWAVWDGERYWTPDGILAFQERHLAILRPMIERYKPGDPWVPEGYDAWWTLGDS